MIKTNIKLTAPVKNQTANPHQKVHGVEMDVKLLIIENLITETINLVKIYVSIGKDCISILFFYAQP